MEGQPPRSKKLNVLPAHTENPSEERAVGIGRFPSWLHRKLPRGADLKRTGDVLEGQRLHTVCEEAKCPNLFECWSKKTATFLVMGKECTRNCGFCSIDFSKSPKPLERDEPIRVAESVKQLGLRHVVITMVARDDLPDGGSGHLVAVMEEIRKRNPQVTIEVLTSDFSGSDDALDRVLKAGPEIFNHNLETVRSLTPRVRHKASYERTFDILRYASCHRYNPKMKVKTGLMLGLGEQQEEVFQTLDALREIACDIVTMGQYLQPNQKKLLVKEFVHPDVFKQYEDYGLAIGIPYLYCGPFIRSSYNAERVLDFFQANQ